MTASIPFEVHHGACLEVMRGMPDNSVDSICTDPPYGLSNHKPNEVIECLKAWRFCGSGSTGKAAMLEGFRFIGIELNLEYVVIARARITWAWGRFKESIRQSDFFKDAA